MSDPDDFHSWLDKAGDDLLCIDNNLCSKAIPWSIVAFHAQQATEKALKAVLVARRIAFPRTHDLIWLLERCLATGEPLAALRPRIALLEPYAVLVRYPGQDVEPDEQAGRAAAEAAHAVVDAITARLSGGV